MLEGRGDCVYLHYGQAKGSRVTAPSRHRPLVAGPGRPAERRPVPHPRGPRGSPEPRSRQRGTPPGLSGSQRGPLFLSGSTLCRDRVVRESHVKTARLRTVVLASVTLPAGSEFQVPSDRRWPGRLAPFHLGGGAITWSSQA